MTQSRRLFLTLRFIALVSWLAAVPTLSSASPISYVIDYTLTEASTVYGPRLPSAPEQTFFAFDEETELFSGFTMTWLTSTSGSGTNFVEVLNGPDSRPRSAIVNNWSPELRRAYFDNLLGGGLWGVGSTTQGIDAWIYMDGYSSYLRLGNNMGDRAVGTFTTTQVPESASPFALLGIAMMGIAGLRKLRAAEGKK